ncbi:MbnH family di-heme enzyme [Nannocystaceae bacterium ST9]
MSARAALSIVASVLVLACVGDPDEDRPPASAEYPFELPRGFPAPFVPEDDPLSEAKVELGRHLFYDVRLSANQTQSCGSCHLQELAFTDGLVHPLGSTGDELARNSLGLTNSAYTSKLTWANPNLDLLEQQIQIPMFGESPVELGITGHEDEVLARLRDDPDYAERFAAAFPELTDATEFEWDHVIHALASFVRVLVSGNSPYDQYLAGDETAISESAKRGATLFFSERLECNHCHGGFNFSLATRHAGTTFTQQAFQNTGLYDIDGEGGYPPGNRGLYEFTFDPADMGRFRPPSLRNVAVTAPYTHDGSVATLEAMIDIYAAGGRVIPDGLPWAGDGRANPFKSGLVSGFELSEAEKADLLAFLTSLTDEQFLTDPRLADPFE